LTKKDADVNKLVGPVDQFFQWEASLTQISRQTRIANIDVSAFRVPLKKPWVSAAHAITHHEHILIEIELESGVKGIGWTSTMGNAGLAVAALARSYLAPMLIGRSIYEHEALWNAIWRRSHQPGPSGIAALAVAGFDLALWDLRGKLAGLPTRNLIGGEARHIKIYASAVNLHLSEKALVEQTREFLDLGNKRFKIKVGRESLEEDLSRIAAVRAVIGDRPLMLDANQRFKPGEALQRINAYARFNPVWMEEPMASDDASSHARLAAVHYLQPNVLKVGGISEWLKLAHLGNCANLFIAPHGALEASVIVAPAIPSCYAVENIDGGSFVDQGIAFETMKIENGTVTLPDLPGLGVEFDMATLASYRSNPNAEIPLADPKKFYDNE
jgi:L-alanine-DL-glutamate epimerase-like enolase superfamily enzyme